MAAPRVVAIRTLETCLDSTTTLQLDLEGLIDEACMRRLAFEGRLDFHPEFPRPFFRVSRNGWYHLQGILGDQKLRAVIVSSSIDIDVAIAELRTLTEDSSASRQK